MPSGPTDPPTAGSPPPTGSPTPAGPTGVGTGGVGGPYVVKPLIPWERILRRWPRPAGPAGPGVLAAAAGAGLVASVCVPLDGPGVGWVVAGVAVVAAVVRSRPGGRIDLTRAAWAAATVGLLAVGTFRAAGWLFALCLLAALVTGSLALTRGAGAPTLAVRTAALAAGTLRAPRWATAGLVALGRGRTHGTHRTTAVRGAATAAVSVALLAVFGSLLASADAAFADLLDDVVPDAPAPAGAARLLLFAAATAVVLGAAAVLAAPPDLTGLDRPAARSIHRLEWTVPIGLLVALFAAFVGVQLTVLFGGDEHVLGADGPTYAEYARSGFWQLLAVTALTLAVLAAAARWVPRDAPADRVLARVLFGALTVLTLVIVASALSRMHTYEQAYGFTRLRVLVSVCELWLGSVLVMVLAAGVRLRARRLPEAAVAAAVAALLALAVADPDRFVAERNVTRYAETGSVDVRHLAGLSADAVPALDRLPAPLRDCALTRIARDLADRDGWRAWNLGRSGARDVLERAPAGPCPGLSGR